MAGVQDIRRDVGDVSPNNYVRPGVSQEGVAQSVEQVGKIGMQIDSELAKNRFAESIETLRSQYITGTTPQEAASVVDEPKEDPDADYVPTENDNRALKDFAQVLDKHQKAVAQGIRSEDMFRISAERLYRIAISKRPGLAREFRGVAEQFLGFDVVGATTDIAARQDKEWLAAEAAKTKTKAEQQADLLKRQREQVEKIYPESAFIPDEQWAAYMANKMPHFIAVTQSTQAARLAKEQVDMLDAQQRVSAEADERYFIELNNAARSSFDSAIDKAMAVASQPNEQGVRLMDTPAGMRQVATGLRDQLLQEMASIDKAVAGRSIPESTKSRYRALNDGVIARLDKVLALEDDKEFMENFNALRKAEAVRSVMSDDEALMISTLEDQFGDTLTAKWLEKNGKTTTLAMSRALTGSLPVNTVAKTGKETASQLIAGVWPLGSQTPADPVAQAKAVEGLSKILSSYYLQDDSNFTPASFTRWEGRTGILPMLTQRAPAIRKSLTDEQSGELAVQIAAASGFSAVRLMALMQKKSPSLIAKVDFDSLWKPDTAGIVAVKPGAKLTPAEQQVLAHFSRQFNRDDITKAVQAYGGGTPEESWAYIAKQVKPTFQIREQMVASAEAQAALQTAQEGSGGPSGGGAGRGVQGAPPAPAVGAVVRGYRFKGGDPSSPGSWEKVE